MITGVAKWLMRLLNNETKEKRNFNNFYIFIKYETIFIIFYFISNDFMFYYSFINQILENYILFLILNF